MNIEKYLKKLGRTVYLSGSDGWRSESYRALVNPIRYKTKLYLSGEYTPIGKNTNDLYLYVGPVKHDLSRLDLSFRLRDSEGNSYIVDKAEKVYVGETPVYIWAVIRKTAEGDLKSC